jgi:ribosome maturation factor RimP
MKAEEIKNIIREVFLKVNDNEEIFVVDIIVSDTAEEKVVSLLLDGDKGINILKCVEISRKMNPLLDEMGFPEDFTREVSSPGTDLPLKMYRQFPKHTGRKLSVALTDLTNFEGKLLSVDGPLLTFETETEEISENNAGKKKKPKTVLSEKIVKFDDIVSATVMISFK